MLTQKKVLTINRCSVRVFKMIESMPIKIIYMSSYNTLNTLVLFEDFNAGAGLRRCYCQRGNRLNSISVIGNHIELERKGA
jgi:hypothetical protein